MTNLPLTPKPTSTPGAYQKARPAGGIRAAVRRSIPPWRIALAGALIWSAIMAASAAVSLILDGWQSDRSIRDVAVVFGLGGFIAFPIGLAAATLASGGRGAEVRFAAAFVAQTVITIAATTGIYALDYRAYYAQWHDEALTVTWIYEFVFTTLGAAFQFAVSGVRLYFPVGFLALAGAAAWFARRPR